MYWVVRNVYVQYIISLYALQEMTYMPVARALFSNSHILDNFPFCFRAVIEQTGVYEIGTQLSDKKDIFSILQNGNLSAINSRFTPRTDHNVQLFNLFAVSVLSFLSEKYAPVTDRFERVQTFCASCKADTQR